MADGLARADSPLANCLANLKFWRKNTLVLVALKGWVRPWERMVALGTIFRTQTPNPKYPNSKYSIPISGKTSKNPNLFRVIRVYTWYPNYAKYPNFPKAQY